MSRQTENLETTDSSAQGSRALAIAENWEQRWHPLCEEWVIIAAHRNKRPWTGDTVIRQTADFAPPYADDCYLCPSNARMSGERNPQYGHIFAFDNDLPCVSSRAPTALERFHLTSSAI